MAWLLLAAVAAAIALRGGVVPFAGAALALWLGAVGLLVALRRRPAPVVPALPLALAWLALGLLSSLWGRAPDRALDAVATLGAAVLAFWLAAGLTGPDRRRLATGLAVLGACVALVALGVMPEGERASFPFGNPNHLGSWLLLPMLLACAALMSGDAAQRGRREETLLAFGLAAVTGAGVAASGSRGAALALAAALAAGALLQRVGARRGVGLLAGLAAGAALALILLPALWPDALPLHDGSNESSAGLRWAVWAAAARAAFEAAPLGTGLGSFAGAFLAERPAGLAYAARHAHSEPLHGLVELGLPFAVLLSLTFLAGVVRLRARLAESSRVRRGAALALSALAAHSLVDFPLHVPAIALVGALLAGVLFGAESTRNGSRVALAGVAVLTLVLGASQLLALEAERRAEQALASGAFETAWEAAGRGLRLRPGRASLHALRADAALGVVRHDGGGIEWVARVREAHARAAAARPDLPALQLRRARALEELGDAAGAWVALESAARIDPAAPAPRLAQVELLLRAGEERAASSALRAALARHPRATQDALESWLRAGAAPDLLGDAVRDRPALERKLAQAFSRHALIDRAADAWGRLATRDPADPELALRAARAWVRAGAPERARGLLERSLQRHPEDAALQAALARLGAGGPGGRPS